MQATTHVNCEYIHKYYTHACFVAQWVAQKITSGHLEALADFQAQGEKAKMSHPSYEHFLPLLYAAGAADAGEPVEFFNEGYQLASIAMRSAI